jgi:outer membrane autotransporter protein
MFGHPGDRPSAFWRHIDFGFLRPSTATDRSDFRTSGLTLGADTRLGDGATVGAAIGYGRNDADIDADDREARAQGQSLILYGTLEPSKAFDIDASVGVAVPTCAAPATDAGMLSAGRGSQLFGSLVFSADLAAPNMRVAPYARYDYVRSHLDAYGERGIAAAAPADGQMAASEDALALGVYAGISLTVGMATIEPELRVEQRRARSGAFDQALACENDPSVAYIGCQLADTDSSLGASLTVPVRFGSAASIAFEYSYASGSDALRAESVHALLQAPF